MLEKPPENTGWLTQIFPWAWVVFLAMWGGTVNFIQKVRTGEVSRWSITEFIGELVTSGFAGVLTYMICQWGGINAWITAALVGIAGHMGSRAIFRMERWMIRKFGV